jgi:hypothetical protein
LNLSFYSTSSFIPPISTKENSQKWYRQGYDIVNVIVNKRQELIDQIKQITKNEIDLLEKESKIIRVKIKMNFYKY